MAFPDPPYTFRALTGLGFLTQWVTMLVNGTLHAMFQAAWQGVLPTGALAKVSWTGIWPVDYILGLLAVFFHGLVNGTEFSDAGPFLMLADLVFALAVCNLMTVVEDRRNRKPSSPWS